ncbi:class I SAM-dependent methyltransferase [Sphingomonas crusticola]|uniref:class I SAM-dependent methyltransferase n=1 Tax=Sphingomonas crusticola TaxID=1697973 RepID=UPI001F072C5B|nr:class I SAM-dependent methyltransferase [Sphingomonas crusticola]
MAVDEKFLREVTAYIQKWDGHLDTYFGTLDLTGKRVLVIGAGWGTEILWILRRGAAHVVGIDPRSGERAFVENALAQHGMSALADRFTFLQGTVVNVGDIGRFDLVMSNNVFEHVDALSANLAAIAPLLPDKEARVHIFADPLFYSSQGHHLPIGAWEHLSQTQESIRARVTPNQWREYRTGMNGMTLTDFLGAVREAGMILLDLAVRPDPNLGRFPELRDTLPSAMKPMDLCLSGLRCTLAFPHNI